MSRSPKKLLVADLLCGAGGSSTGCARALAELGLSMELVCVNHWGVAIETHKKNHPEARHYVQDIATVRPHLLVPEGYLDLLMASPTCTHHSVARGGKPTSDQQRSDPWHIITWFTELRVKRAIIENVWEYTKWGPVDPRSSKPIKDRECEYFNAWMDTIRRVGATSIEYRKLNAANYGTAQTRQRFIAKIRFDKVAVGWAPITHMKRETGAGKLALFPTLKPWRPAREIIDWSIKGRSIFGRPKPLSWKSLDRLLAGMLRFAWPDVFIDMLLPEIERALIWNIRENFSARNSAKKTDRLKSRKRIKQAVARLWRHRTEPVIWPGSTKPAQPMVVTLRLHADGRSIEEPLPAIVAGGQHISLAQPIVLPEPFVLSQASGGAARPVTEPLPTAPTGGAHALIAPYYGSGSGSTCSSTDEPLPTVTSKARFGMVMPITHNDGSDRARDVEIDPLPTVTTANRGELAFITASFGEREGQAPRVHSLDDPVPTLCAKGRVNMVEARKHDILYRMFMPHELAAAMGFNKGEARYEFAGNKTEQIKQIGNAVPVEMMEAEVKAIVADAAPKRMLAPVYAAPPDEAIRA